MTSVSRAAVVEANIAHHLTRVARERPYRPAIFAPAGRDLRGRPKHVHWTYKQLDEESDRLARGFRDIGIGPGVRTVLMVPPSLDLFALVFGLFKAGAPLVMVDPGMGLEHLGACLGRAEPRAFIGIPKAHAARAALGWAKSTIGTVVNVAPRWARPLAFRARNAYGIDEVKTRGERNSSRAMTHVEPDDLAAILFTSGSTGPPKGALYRYSTFTAQVEAIRNLYDFADGEIDLPTFPMFALFDAALGMVTVVPEMDPTRPAEVNPERITEAILGFGVTNMFGSPALLDTVARWAVPRRLQFPTLRRVVSAGAPVSPRILEEFARLLPDGAKIHTPYGATEALPVATISHDEVLRETRARTERGEGVCVGKPVASIEVSVIRIEDGPIPEWSDELRVPKNAIGEIVVSGGQVTESYVASPAHDGLSKIRGPKGTMHRMGDLGFLDEDGRVWFCGRKSHRVVLDDGATLFTIPCEGPFNAHRDVKRSALVGARVNGRTIPVMCIEPWMWRHIEADQARLIDALREIGSRFDHTRVISHFLLRERFPVDIRHNAKIRREDLAIWASKTLERESQTLGKRP